VPTSTVTGGLTADWLAGEEQTLMMYTTRRGNTCIYTLLQTHQTISVFLEILVLDMLVVNSGSSTSLNTIYLIALLICIWWSVVNNGRRLSPISSIDIPIGIDQGLIDGATNTAITQRIYARLSNKCKHKWYIHYLENYTVWRVY